MPVSRFRFQISHVGFSSGFSLALFAICNGLNIDKVASWFRDADGLDYSALVAYLLAGLCLSISVFVLLAHRLTIKPVAILLVICSAAATYFIAKYGVAIDSSMLRNAIHTDVTEVGQLLSLQMIPYLVFLVIVPVIIILLADVTFQASGRYLFG